MGARVSNFDFREVSLDYILKKIKYLDSVSIVVNHRAMMAYRPRFSNWRTVTSQAVCARFLAHVSQPVFSPRHENVWYMSNFQKAW